MMRRQSKRRRLVAPAPVTLGPDLSGPKTSGSSSASVHLNTETEPLHFDDVELEGLEGELEELHVDNQGLGIDTGLDYQHGTDPNALEVPASALCTELTGSSSSTSALVDVDLESGEQFDPRIEYANESGPKECTTLPTAAPARDDSSPSPMNRKRRSPGQSPQQIHVSSTNLPHTDTHDN